MKADKGETMLEFIAGFVCCLILMIIAEAVHVRRQRKNREWLDGK